MSIKYGNTTKTLNFNKENIIASLGILSKELGNLPIITLNQTHSNKVVVFENLETFDNDADAVITLCKNVFVAVKTADCLPLFLYNDDFVCAIHLGRKGILDGLLENVLAKLKELGLEDFDQVQAIIGPNLQSKNHICFDQVLSLFPPQFVTKFEKDIHIITNQKLWNDYLIQNPILPDFSGTLDVENYIVFLLQKTGITKIVSPKSNTFDNPNLHSYRRDYPNHGLMLNYIAMISA